MASNYEKICNVPTDYGITFTKYKSNKTGLTVALADIEGNNNNNNNDMTIFTRFINLFYLNNISFVIFIFSTSC